MPHHLIAWYSTAFNNASLTKLDVQSSDPLLYPDTSAKTYTPPQDLQLLAAYAGGTSLEQARIEAPSLLRVGYPSIVPLESAASPSGDDVGLATYQTRPLRLVNGEGIAVTAANGASGTVAACLLCSVGTIAVPPGEGFWLRYTDSTAASPGAWTTLAAALDQDLPAGTYAIIGMDHWSATAVAARLIIEGVRYRPGIVAHNTAAASRTNEMFYQAKLGVWGYFTNRGLPFVEVLCTGADAAHVGYLYVVRVGDGDMIHTLPGMQ